jgi:hypothetical protein
MRSLFGFGTHREHLLRVVVEFDVAVVRAILFSGLRLAREFDCRRSAHHVRIG